MIIVNSLLLESIVQNYDSLWLINSILYIINEICDKISDVIKESYDDMVHLSCLMVNVLHCIKKKTVQFGSVLYCSKLS